MKITKKDLKMLIIESILLKNEVDKDGNPVLRKEFPRDHIRNIKDIQKIISSKNVVTVLNGAEEREEPFGYVPNEKEKIVGEMYTDAEIEFNEAQAGTIRYFLKQKEEWRMLSDEGLTEVDALMKEGDK